MPKTKQQKEEMLKTLVDDFAASRSAVFVDFKGLGVVAIEAFRNKCREEGLKYSVSKKTLMKLALEKNNFTQKDLIELDGSVGTVFGIGDEVSAAKVAKEFSKEHDKMKLLGGLLATEAGFKYMELADVESLASLPGKQELLSKLVGSINAPISGFVNALAGVPRGLVNVLSAIKDQKA